MSKIKVNVLALGAISTLALLVLGWMYPDEGDKVLVVAGAIFGGFASIMKSLVEPDPNPSVPESTVAQMLDAMGKKGA